jgi:hypothetical protein
LNEEKFLEAKLEEDIKYVKEHKTGVIVTVILLLAICCIIPLIVVGSYAFIKYRRPEGDVPRD